ncbi:PAS domain-containing sensor histidine kinase [Natrinema caseinilyticum]|uniref:PAS domain-containing sensor histidine kinase n=1 Tax=Natrinema caseinilyticum TaxID=2961570 RepID=UPI0020C4A0FE|nr:PAS domain-containing sensor histidine kinase [Natrinema caseinilyticum]
MEGDRNADLPGVFDDIDTGIVLRDPETGAVLDTNDQVERLYGYSRSELLEMEIEEYTAPSTRFSQDEAIERIRSAAAGEPQTFEWQIKRANGELIWVRVRLNKTTLDDTTCVVAEIRDITEYKARERRLRLLNRVVRHNLRNETNVLIGYADRLKRAVEEQTIEEEVDMILEIAAEIGTLSDSIRQVQEIAKPDAAKRTPTDIGKLVTEIVTELEAEYPAADLTVSTRAEVWVNADDGLRHAIIHAIDNAITHNDDDAPSVVVRVDTEPNTNQGAVSVLDTGPTIPTIETDVLKEHFAASTTHHGSGVGLWVMQWCVDSLGGELVFEENSPRGNIVRFLLPEIQRPETETEPR